MKLTMWEVVVVLNVYTKFREKQSASPFLHSIIFRGCPIINLSNGAVLERLVNATL